jgi:hypothetical protein
VNTPFESPRQFVRVLLKAIALLIIFDALQMAFGLGSALDHWSIYRYFTPPTMRLGLADQIGDPAWWRLNVLLDAHEIAQLKAPDEYRVVFLGDSSTFCLYCRAGEAIPKAVTDLGVTIDGKRVRAYNLAYPGPDWLKDILILKHALPYQPDAIVWLVTAKGSSNQPTPAQPDAHLFTRINADELPELQRQYGFTTWETQQYADADTWYQSSIWLRGGRLRDWLTLLAQTIRTALINPGQDQTKQYLLPDEPVTQRPIRFPAEITSDLPGYDALPNDRWELLRVGQRMAQQTGVPLLLVNEPIYLAGGPHSNVNYNSDYERAVYDRFRTAMIQFTHEHGLPYLDLWNHLPPEEFSNTPLHYNLQGNIHVAQEIAAELQKMSTAAH